jgi:uncharacterized protein YbjT (DUF2867 family)
MFLVSGATGNVGAQVVRALHAANEPVRALARGDRPAALAPGVDVVTGDLNQPDSLTNALAGARGVFLLSGYADMAGLVSKMAEAGVQRVVLLSGNSAANGDPSNAVSAYMMRSEAAVRGPTMAWTILRPYGFFSNALQWAVQLRAGDVVSAPFAHVPIAAIDPADIAAVATLALTTDDHVGATYHLSGPEPIVAADRVRILGQVLGRNLRLHPQPDDEARQQMSTEMPVEYVDAFFSFFVDGTLDESQVLPTVPQLLHRPARSFGQWASQHADAFN